VRWHLEKKTRKLSNPKISHVMEYVLSEVLPSLNPASCRAWWTFIDKFMNRFSSYLEWSLVDDDRLVDDTFGQRLFAVKCETSSMYVIAWLSLNAKSVNIVFEDGEDTHEVGITSHISDLADRLETLQDAMCDWLDTQMWLPSDMLDELDIVDMKHDVTIADEELPFDKTQVKLIASRGYLDGLILVFQNREDHKIAHVHVVHGDGKETKTFVAGRSKYTADHLYRQIRGWLECLCQNVSEVAEYDGVSDDHSEIIEID
jgi:hypothetical protein